MDGCLKDENCRFAIVYSKDDILKLIKKSVASTDPDATVILFGSYARGDNREDSDIDLLVLVDKEEIYRDNRIKITYPLYDIEFETGIVISPIGYSKNAWKN